MTQQILQIGDVIEWDGREMAVEHIEGEYAVWYGTRGVLQGKRIAKCRIYDYGSGIRIIRRKGRPFPTSADRRGE